MGKVLLVLLIVVAAVVVLTAAVNAVLMLLQLKFIEKNVKSVKYENQLRPLYDKNSGAAVFTTDGDFSVMQLTDVHIGGGWMSFNKDRKAIEAVSAMITAEKPDLVAVTGDIAYPVPFQAGTFNNRIPAKIFGRLMEKLGVYWAPVLGNHDTEAYACFNRAYIGRYYEEHRYSKNHSDKYCLFKSGDKSLHGVGNYVVQVKNTSGVITQCLFFMDTGSYVDNDFFGIFWRYDGMHQNQIDWYEKQLKDFEKYNSKLGAGVPKSLMFFHIPIAQYKEAWNQYRENGFSDTEEVKRFYGEVGEKGGVFPSLHPDKVFETICRLGSTKGTFCGHDHLNNFSMDYKGIRLTYGLTVDYLAYVGIKNYGFQRGCTMIDIRPDGSFDCKSENYYQEKYGNADCGSVTMEHYYPNVERPV